MIKQQHWSEVFVLLGGLTEETNEYLSQLLNAHSDLALRTLKEIENLSPQMAIRILQLESEVIGERRRVFIELERRVKSTEQLFYVISAYIDAVKSNIPRVDLYFIQEVLEKFDYLRTKNLLDKVFEYLPAVPENIIDNINLEAEVLPYWCEVPEGNFLLGASLDNQNAPPWVPKYTEVFVSAFQIGRVPVTNIFYESFDPSHKEKRDFQDDVLESELDFHPVVKVSWYEAVIFCQWLARKHPGVRLPTEAEWEKAASWTATNEKLNFLGEIIGNPHF